MPHHFLRTFILVLSLGLLMSASGCSKEKSPATDDHATTATQNTSGTAPEVTAADITVEESHRFEGYETVYIVDERDDGAKTYYVLVNPADFSSNAFQAKTRDVLRQVTLENGGKVTIKAFDRSEDLELIFGLIGNETLGRPLTPEEYASVQQHYLALFYGQYSREQYSNTLHWFPEAEASTPAVGKYKAVEEFNP